MRGRIGNIGLMAVVSMALLAAFPVIAWAMPVLPAGIAVDSWSLVGMTAEETKAVVQEYVDGLPAQSVTFSVNGQDTTTMAEELGFHWISANAVDEVAGQYVGGDLIKQHMIEKDLAAVPVNTELETEVDSVKVKTFVGTQCQGITAESRNASITRENGQFVTMDFIPGHMVGVVGAEAALNETPEAGLEKPIEVTAQATEEQPTITSEALAAIQGVLDTYTTGFGSGGATCSANLATDAAKINGYVLMPGDVLLDCKCLQPFTTVDGYKTAAAYENGQVVDSICLLHVSPSP